MTDVVDILIRDQRTLFGTLALLMAAVLVLTALWQTLQSPDALRLLTSALNEAWYISQGSLAAAGEPASPRLFSIASLGVLLRWLGNALRKHLRTRRGVSMLLVVGLAIAAWLWPPVAKTAMLVPPIIERRNEKSACLMVFIHGFTGSGSGPHSTWQQFPTLARADARFIGCDLLSIDYPSYVNRRGFRLVELASWIYGELKQSFSEYERVVLISHSMGGLIARELVLDNRLAGQPDRFALLVSVATPHGGAHIAQLAEALGLDLRLVADMSPQAPFLAGLQEAWNTLAPRPLSFCVTSPADRVVTMESATHQCDRFGRVPQWGHVELVKPEGPQDERYRIVMDKVSEALAVNALNH